MKANTLRAWLILALVVAAVISVVGKKADSAFVGWVSFAVFLSALVLYVSWRRAALREHVRRLDHHGQAGRHGRGREQERSELQGPRSRPGRPG